ncbi:MAG: hypothetical protein JO202_19950 [Ktedonobacteraceae bacterium]|nr:hypothetical protein [Ktedonobacteraceae bacterium]
MKQPRRRHGDSSKAQSLFLTLDDVLLLKKALLPLEQLIITSPKSLPNIQLAHETLKQVQGKVSSMMEQGANDNTIPFNANEVVILHTAVRLFPVNVEWQTNPPETYEALKLSLFLQSKLAPIMTRIRR